ncbi:MAG TPA: ribosome-associated translation inhibitor RaiA [Steroidobacteraceae bacterium]|nr:ribosome-associated translation inhibitor RaiA [Steroidobacteraceae bacterium]
MQLKLTGHHVEVTDSMRAYVQKRLERVKRHFDNVIDVTFVMSVDKLQHKAEATVHVSGGNIHADAIETDMYAAIDALVDKLDRSVLKHKEKQHDHHATEGRAARQ